MQFNLISTYLLVCIFVTGCKEKATHSISSNSAKVQDVKKSQLVTQEKNTIKVRFSPPQNFIRTEIDTQSFASYLRNFPLLDINEQVHLYNGQLKSNQSIHASILDIDVGNKDLQQCADAVMRLRAEYLYGQQKYEDIAFDFTNGWRFEYAKWRAGNDLVVEGNSTKWKPSSAPKDSYIDFRTYMDWVFMYAGTLSLSKELNSKNLIDIAIGNVFILGGSPGHAVLVMDIAEHPESGDRAFLLAQSYMPAQQIHILKNLNNQQTSPWYLLSEIEGALYTPEWTFSSTSLAEFQ